MTTQDAVPDDAALDALPCPHNMRTDAVAADCVQCLQEAIAALRAQVADQAREIARSHVAYDMTARHYNEALKLLGDAEQERDEWKDQALKFKVERDGAVERGQLMFAAKNEWADRAHAAEQERDSQQRVCMTVMEERDNALTAHDLCKAAADRYKQERDALRADAERWRFVVKHGNYQGSLNGYPTFTQAVDAARLFTQAVDAARQAGKP